MDEVDGHSSYKKKAVPTDASLAMAKEMAAKLDLPFDFGETKVLGTHLLAAYFHEIVHVLNVDPETITIEHGLDPTYIRATIGMSTDHSHATIFVDECLHFWLFAVNFLTLLNTCFDFTEVQKKELARLLAIQFTMFRDPLGVHESSREALAPLFLEFADIALVANAHTLTQTVFAICHELSHQILKHGIESDRDQEFEADKKAFTYLLAIFNERDDLRYAQIDTGTLCSPCLLFYYLSASNTYLLGSDFDTDSHPPNRDRATALEAQRNEWSEKSQANFPKIKRSFDDLVTRIVNSSLR